MVTEKKIFCAMLTTGVCDMHTIHEGWQLVPQELTQEMWAAMAQMLYGFKFEMGTSRKEFADDLYRTILAAAPSTKVEKNK